MFNPFIDQPALSKVIFLSDAKQLSLPVITSDMCPSHTFADVHKFVKGEDSNGGGGSWGGVGWGGGGGCILPGQL